jgi:DnaJ-class molecular chaperone
MTTELQSAIAACEARAAEYCHAQTYAGDSSGSYTERAALLDALALTLRNGGGCPKCHGQQQYVGYKRVDCPHCHGTGVSDAMRAALHAAGVL